MSNLSTAPVSYIVGDVAYEFRTDHWYSITAGHMDAPMPVMRHIIAEQKVIVEELRSMVRNLESELLKATDENLALRLKRGKGRVAS